MKSLNKVQLRGWLYLVSSDRIKNKPYLECALLTGEGSVFFFERHKIVVSNRNAVHVLAYIRANEDKAIHTYVEGKLLHSTFDLSSVVQVSSLEFLVNEAVDEKADELIRRLKLGDSFLEASFKETAFLHSQQLKFQQYSFLPADE